MCGLLIWTGAPHEVQATADDTYNAAHGNFQAEKKIVKADDWADFIQAYQDETVTKIVLTKDIEDTSQTGALGPTNYQRKASIEIDGQGHCLTLKQYHGLRTSNKPTGYTETVDGKEVPRSMFHMHDLSLRQNLNGIETALGNYSSFAFVGASDVHASWGLEASAYEENMTKNWYFRFGNIDTKKDDNADNAKGVARLVMAYGAEVSVYGELDLSTSAENMYVGSLVVEDETTWTGVVEHYDYSTVWFAIASPKDGTGKNEVLSIGKNSQVMLSNKKHGKNFPGFYGHYKYAVLQEKATVNIETNGVAWQFDQDNSQLQIQKGATLQLTSTGNGKVLQFGRGFLNPSKIKNSQIIVKSGGALIVKGQTNYPGQLSVVDFTGGLQIEFGKAYESTNSGITVEKDAYFDVQNGNDSQNAERRRVLNLRNGTNQLKIAQGPVYLWETDLSVTAPQEETTAVATENFLIQGEGKHTFQTEKGTLTYINGYYRRIQTKELNQIKDTDGDGLADEYEEMIGTDPKKADTDGDGLPDGIEWHQTTSDPTKADSEGDGIQDGARDTDGDGIQDIQEVADGTDLSREDTDGDGLSDREEKTHQTDPLVRDTDEDGLSDGDEIKLGLDPLNPQTDGQTLDSEKNISQSLSEEQINEQFFEATSVFIPRLDGNVAKVLDKQALIEVSPLDNFDSQRALIGTPIELETSLKDADLTLHFDLSHSPLKNDAEKMNNAVICQYIDDELVPFPTAFSNGMLSADIRTGGVYLVLDNQVFLKSLGVDVLGDIASHSVNQPKAARLFQNSANGLVDIVFVIDRSGSMDGPIKQVQTNLTRFVEELTNIYQVNANFGLVTYTDDSITVVSDGTNDFYTDPEKIKAQLNNLRTAGGTEYVTRALELARNMDYRPHAEKYVILLTDESGDFGRNDLSLTEMTALLERDDITTSVITTYSLENNYKSLYQQTGGIFANIYGDFSAELLKIAENIGENANEGTWALLSDFQAVRLNDDVTDTDGDGLSDTEELGIQVAKDMTPFIKLLCEKNNVPFALYQGKQTVDVYQYTSNPVLKDTDFDGIEDKEDIEKKGGNQFSGKLIDENGEKDYGINNEMAVAYTLDYRKFFNAHNTAYHKDLSVLGSVLSNVVYENKTLEMNEGTHYSGDIEAVLGQHGM